jgi:hypothetical protein
LNIKFLFFLGVRMLAAALTGWKPILQVRMLAAALTGWKPILQVRMLAAAFTGWKPILQVRSLEYGYLLTLLPEWAGQDIKNTRDEPEYQKQRKSNRDPDYKTHCCPYEHENQVDPNRSGIEYPFTKTDSIPNRRWDFELDDLIRMYYLISCHLSYYLP